MPDKDILLKQVIGDLETWENYTDNFTTEFNRYADNYKVNVRTKKRGDPYSLTNTFVPETTRAVETLTTTIYRMLTSNDPNFDVVGMNPYITSEQLQAISILLRYQQDHLEYRRKLLNAIRTCVLFGTVVVEEPWSKFPFANNSTVAKGTDFVPRSLLQVAFDPMALDIEESDWIGTLDWISPLKLRQLATADIEGYIWDKQEVEMAIDENKDSGKLPQKILSRRSSAGYKVTDTNLMELYTAWRPVEGEDPNKDWVTGVINRTHVVRMHPNPSNHGIRPFRVAKYIDFEMEPYGLGVGRLGLRAQDDMNANRNRTSDIITFALFGMWKVSRLAGLNRSDLKIRLWNLIELDDISGLEPIRPDLQAANFGIKLEEIGKDDFRNTTGAVPSLQAAVIAATATEASIAQNEAIRRVSVLAEIIADSLVRKHLYVSHMNNVQFLNDQYWLSITGKPEPTRIFPKMLSREVDFFVRTTTDKDFRPERVRRMIEFLQVLTTTKSQFQLDLVNVVPIVKEIARAFGIDPNILQKQPTAIEQLIRSQQLAQNTLGQASSLPNLPSAAPPPGPSIQTPVGLVEATP